MRPVKPTPRPAPGRPAPPLPSDGIVRLFRDRGGRNGKTVTLIRGLPERGPALESRVAQMKRICGAGGTLQDGAVQVQGDPRGRLAEPLPALRYTVKLAGGHTTSVSRR